MLDLDETLIHYYEDNGKEKYRERPKAYDFIKIMAEYYELVIFTAGLQDVFVFPFLKFIFNKYADWVLKSFDRENLISHKLYRRHCS